MQELWAFQAAELSGRACQHQNWLWRSVVWRTDACRLLTDSKPKFGRPSCCVPCSLAVMFHSLLSWLTQLAS